MVIVRTNIVIVLLIGTDVRAEVQFEALPIALGAAGGAKGAESAVAARVPGAQLGRPAGPAVHSVPLGSSPPSGKFE